MTWAPFSLKKIHWVQYFIYHLEGHFFNGSQYFVEKGVPFTAE